MSSAGQSAESREARADRPAQVAPAGAAAPMHGPAGAPPAASGQVIFIGNGRCYHTMDWYRNAQELLAPRIVPFATDLVESEGQLRLLRPTDPVIALWNIDRLMFARQSAGGNLWRNLVKAAMIPLQVWKTRRIARAHAQHANLVFHAHSMYYLWICWLAGVDYVGTPQGSEILVRPGKSRIYRCLAGKALRAAKAVTVDSVNMQNRIRELGGGSSILIQNGIDVAAIRRTTAAAPRERAKIVSNRGLYPLYRIDQILAGRAHSAPDRPITFIYPSWEDNYKAKCFRALRGGDADLGRLPTRQQMYELLVQTFLVVSIPASDSSPRSVYEAVFCGCCVAVVDNPWIDQLPDCMKARLHRVDLADADWFGKAVERARIITRSPYVPSERAVELFDQKRALQRLAGLCYGLEAAGGKSDARAVRPV